MGQEAEKGGDRERRACSAKVAGGGRLGIARGAPSASRTISRTPANGSSPGSAAFGGCCCGCCLRVRSAANCAASSSPESCCCISALRDGLRHAGRCTSAGSTAIINSGVDSTAAFAFERDMSAGRAGFLFIRHRCGWAAATREVERGDKRNTSSSGAVLAARPHEVKRHSLPNTTFSAC